MLSWKPDLTFGKRVVFRALAEKGWRWTWLYPDPAPSPSPGRKCVPGALGDCSSVLWSSSGRACLDWPFQQPSLRIAWGREVLGRLHQLCHLASLLKVVPQPSLFLQNRLGERLTGWSRPVSRFLGSSANKNISCLPRVWSLQEREWLPNTLELGWVSHLNCRAMVKERMWAQPKAGAKFALAQRPALPPLPS